MWEKARHRVIFGAMRIFYRPYLWFKTGYRTGIHRLKKKQGQLIVCNHQSVYDAYMINMAFDRPVFIMAGDYLFNRGKASDRMNWFFAPIPKVKAGSDPASLLTTLRVLREGSVVGIFPEASRTYDGRFGEVPKSMGRFIKKIKVSVTVFTLRGGYGADPRWCRSQRFGHFVGKVSKTLSPDEIEKMSEEEIVQFLDDNLRVDETKTRFRYLSNHRAEYIERLLYCCPKCGAFSTLHSKGNAVTCTACGLKAVYTEATTFRFEDFDTPITNVADWVDWQDAQLQRFDGQDGVVFRDEGVLLETCDRNKPRERLSVGAIEIDHSELRVVTQDEAFRYPFDEITLISPIGDTKILFTTRKGSFMINGPKRFNPYKYVKWLYHVTGNEEQVR